MKKIITSKDLRDMGACEMDYRIFRRVFPDGAAINLENLKLARDHGLGVNWFTASVVDFKVMAEFDRVNQKELDKYHRGKMTYSEFSHGRDVRLLAMLRKYFHSDY